MTSVPPLLPDEILARVFRLARADGLSVSIVAGIFALAAAAAGDFPFAIVFVLGAGAGAMELHGAALLQAGEARGMNWLVASQPFLLLIVLAYCALKLTHFEVPPMPEMFQASLETTARQLGLTVEAYLRLVHRVTVGLVASVSLVYQSGMTLYYLRRRRAVALALATAQST